MAKIVKRAMSSHETAGFDPWWGHAEPCDDAWKAIDLGMDSPCKIGWPITGPSSWTSVKVPPTVLLPAVQFDVNVKGAMMLEWVKRRAKTRKDGRMVLITSVVFDADVFNELCKYITRDDGQRSDIINKALRDALATPGWIESAREEPLESKSIAFKRTQPPSSNSRIHARGGVDGPKTKRSPGSRPPKSKAARSSKRGGQRK